MDINEKLDRLADVFDRDTGSLALETPLGEIGWDSMAMLSVIALAKQNGKSITGAMIREFKTVGDIANAAF